MNVRRTRDIAINHQTSAHAYLFGSIPAWTRGVSDIRDELLGGECYVIDGEIEALESYVSITPMAREMSGVWLLDTLVPVNASRAHWDALLVSVVAAHVGAFLSARIVQRFSVDQVARSEATEAAGWKREGVLTGYYRSRGVPVDAEQWALYRGSAS